MYQQIHTWAQSNFFLILTAMFTALFLIVVSSNHIRNKKFDKIKKVILFLYIAVILYITIVSRMKFSGSIDKWNLNVRIPYGLKSGKQKIFWEDIANIMLFLPIGVLIKESYKDRLYWYHCIIAGALLSGIIEVMQLIFHCGYCDINDFIYNVAGTVIGYSIAGWRNNVE